jgi:sugar/nucleoside kinase (ribokinase family)
MRQLGVPTALLGVVGDDEVGANLLAQAGRDRIDVSWVIRREDGQRADRGVARSRGQVPLSGGSAGD